LHGLQLLLVAQVGAMILAVSMFVGYNSGDRESFKPFSNT